MVLCTVLYVLYCMYCTVCTGVLGFLMLLVTCGEVHESIVHHNKEVRPITRPSMAAQSEHCCWSENCSHRISGQLIWVSTWTWIVQVLSTCSIMYFNCKSSSTGLGKWLLIEKYFNTVDLDAVDNINVWVCVSEIKFLQNQTCSV